MSTVVEVRPGPKLSCANCGSAVAARQSDGRLVHVRWWRAQASPELGIAPGAWAALAKRPKWSCKLEHVIPWDEYKAQRDAGYAAQVEQVEAAVATGAPIRRVTPEQQAAVRRFEV